MSSQVQAISQPSHEETMPSQPSANPEWHRHSDVDQSSSLPASLMLYNFFSAQFAAFQTHLNAKFDALEQKVDNKLKQLEVSIERKITKFAYNNGSKLHQLDKNLTGQMQTIRKDHFHSDKWFRQLVESVQEIVNLIR